MSGASAFDKQAALQYLQNSQVNEELQRLLNELCRARPADPFGFLSRGLAARAAPAPIEQVVFQEAAGSDGRPSLQVVPHCVLRSEPQAILSHRCPGYDGHEIATGSGVEAGAGAVLRPRGSLPLERVDAGEARAGRQGLQGVARGATEAVSQLLKGRRIDDQAGIDQVLWEADTTELKEGLGGNVILAASVGLARAAAACAGVGLDQHLGWVFGRPGPAACPVPIVDVLRCQGGKLKANGLAVIATGPVAAAMEKVQELCFHLRAVLAKKHSHAPPPVPTPAGFVVHVDKMEQLFDLVSEAASLAGLELGPDLSILLDCGGARLYDSSKHKYDLDGHKSIHDLAAYYVSLVERHSYVASVLDPFVYSEETHAEWVALNDALPNDCAVLSSHMDHGQVPKQPGAFGMQQLRTSQCGTLSRLFEAAASSRFYLAADSVEHDPEYLADLGIALGAEFLRAGYPCGVHSGVYSRLMEIEGLGLPRPEP